MSKPFTFYCDVHFWEVKLGPSPSEAAPGKPLAPACPTCFQRMYWVPNGGTVIPREQTPEVGS